MEWGVAAGRMGGKRKISRYARNDRKHGGDCHSAKRLAMTRLRPTGYGVAGSEIGACVAPTTSGGLPGTFAETVGPLTLID